MNKIHSGILAIVTSIFLIQAIDPPEKAQNSMIPHTVFGNLPFVRRNQTQKTENTVVSESEAEFPAQHPVQNLHLLHHYLTQIEDDQGKPSNGSNYEKLLQKDFVQPLLQLYKRQPEPMSSNLSLVSGTRISREDTLENVGSATREDFGDFIQKYSHLNPLRRDDVIETTEDEHIGEILPPSFNLNTHETIPRIPPQPKTRKSYDYNNQNQKPSPFIPDILYRKPIRLPGVRFRPEYEPSDNFYDQPPEISNDDLIFPRNPKRNNLPPTDVAGYRIPRRPRAFGDGVESGFATGKDKYFDQTQRQPQWQGMWGVRRPRVIFPTDLVTFKEPGQEEPDWLAADGNLQELQEQDTRDRGSSELCLSGATCEFFLTCWLSGGLLDSPCDGLLKGCCQRGASKNGQSPALAIGTMEAPQDRPRAKSESFDSNSYCGISNRQQAQRRIVGGDEAGFGTFPWQAYIRIGSSRCGGSLVSRRHVVTAGHCVARATPKQVHVTLGDYVINSAVEPLPAYTFGVSQIQVHPYFKFTPQADRFDVAVLRLDRTAHQLPHITPICLPPRGESFLGEVGVAAGWGALSPGSRLRPQTLQAVPVPVIDNRVCERWHRSKGIGVVIYEEMLCAGYKTGGRDSCQGDSGGPLMLQKQSRWFLIGIVSAGYSCAQAGQPGIYHRVAHTVDWITRAIGGAA